MISSWVSPAAEAMLLHSGIKYNVFFGVCMVSYSFVSFIKMQPDGAEEPSLMLCFNVVGQIGGVFSLFFLPLLDAAEMI